MILSRVNIEHIERNFRDVLPPRCVRLLSSMAEDMGHMEQCIKEITSVLNDYTTILRNIDADVARKLAAFEKRHSDRFGDVAMEDIHVNEDD